MDVDYRGGRRAPVVRAVRNASLSIDRGRTYGLVGESGSGKSTLAKAVTRLIPAASGTVELVGVDLHRLKGRELRAARRRMPMVFQDPFSAVNPSMDIAAIVSEGISAAGRNVSSPERVMELLELVDLSPEFGTRRPRELSGGQLQRVTLARALACDPDLVVLDEPLSALDVSSQVQIVALLRKLQDELGLAYLLISHDLAVVRLLAHHIGVMNAGEIVEEAATEDLFQSPLHPYTRRLLDSMPIPHPALRRETLRQTTDEPLDPSTGVPGCRYERRCEYAVERCHGEPPLLRDTGDRFVRCHLDLRVSDRPGDQRPLGSSSESQPSSESASSAIRRAL